MDIIYEQSLEEMEVKFLSHGTLFRKLNIIGNVVVGRVQIES